MEDMSLSRDEAEEMLMELISSGEQLYRRGAAQSSSSRAASTHPNHHSEQHLQQQQEQHLDEEQSSHADESHSSETATLQQPLGSDLSRVNGGANEGYLDEISVDGDLEGSYGGQSDLSLFNESRVRTVFHCCRHCILPCVQLCPCLNCFPDWPNLTM